LFDLFLTSFRVVGTSLIVALAPRKQIVMSCDVYDHMNKVKYEVDYDDQGKCARVETELACFGQVCGVETKQGDDGENGVNGGKRPEEGWGTLRIDVISHSNRPGYTDDTDEYEEEFN